VAIPPESTFHARTGSKTRGIVGPQAGNFTINQTHPLAEDLAFFMYAPSGYRDLVEEAPLTWTKDDTVVGPHGAYFPLSATNSYVSITSGPVKPANSEWSVAGLTDFTAALNPNGANFALHSAGHYTIERDYQLATYDGSYQKYTQVMTGRDWKVHSFSAKQGTGTGAGYIGGEYDGLTVAGGYDTSALTLTEVLGQTGISRAWNDCIFVALWHRALTLSEHAMLGHLETSFLWDLLQPRTKRTYIFPSEIVFNYLWQSGSTDHWLASSSTEEPIVYREVGDDKIRLDSNNFEDYLYLDTNTKDLLVLRKDPEGIALETTGTATVDADLTKPQSPIARFINIAM
jgi:hypothetical protein